MLARPFLFLRHQFFRGSVAIQRGIFRNQGPPASGMGRICDLEIGVIEYARGEALLGIRVWLRVEDQNKRIGGEAGAADGLISDWSLKPSVIA